MPEMHKTEVYALNDVTNIDVPRLYEAGFQLVTFDLDKTLVGQHELELPLDRQELIIKLGEAGINIAIISNANGHRVERVRLFEYDISELTGSECISVVPSDVVGGKKKPHPNMFAHALYQSDIDTPLNAIHFGDQVRSDVVGAEAAGYRTAVVVKPMGEGDDLTVRLIGRPFIEPVLRYQRFIPLPSNFPDSLPDEAYRSIDEL